MTVTARTLTTAAHAGRKISLALAAFVAAAALTAPLAHAEVVNQQSQRLDQNVNINCVTGAYGQTTTCTATAQQSGQQNQQQVQRQIVGLFQNARRIVCRDANNCMYEHKTVNAGVDPSFVGMIGAVLASTATGVGLFAKKIALG